MGVTLTSYAEYGNASLTVTNSAELNAAVKQLAGSTGGTITVDPNGGPYNLTLNGVGSSNAPVLIESGSGGMAHFESLTFVNSSYIAVDGIDVDTSHKTSQLRSDDDLRIERSDHIEIANSNFTGSASGYLDGTGGGTAGNTGAFVLKSQDILIDNNTFTNHFYGIKAVDTVGLIFEDNEITQFQADAFHGGGLQDAQILSNHLHTALGSVQSMVHSDFIQIRGAGTTLQNSNIEIANNLIDSSSGSGAQGIHMGSGGTSIRSTDISIHDNVIHTALPHGIGVGSIDNLEVYNNTVLWNQATSVVASPGATPNSWDARIIISGSTNTSVHDNIASWIRINGTHDPNGGYQIVYDDPNAANYADKHIVNLDGSGNPNSYDLNIDQSSPLYGSFGAAMSSGGTATSSGTLGSFGSSTPAPAPVVTNNTQDTSSSNDTSGSGDSSDGGGVSVPTSGSDGGSSEGTVSLGSSEGSEDATPVLQPSIPEGPTIINSDVSSPEAPATTGSGEAGSSGTGDSSTVPETTATDDTGGAAAPSGDTTSSSGDTSADDTGGAKIPKGRSKKLADDQEEEDSNILSKFFSMIFGGGDDGDTSSSSPNGYGKGGAKANQSLDDIVPVTEWIDDADTSSASSDEDDDDDTMLAA